MQEMIEVEILESRVLVVATVHSKSAVVISSKDAKLIVDTWANADPGTEEVGGPYLRKAWQVPGYGFVTSLFGGGELTMSPWERISWGVDKATTSSKDVFYLGEGHVPFGFSMKIVPRTAALMYPEPEEF